MIKGVSDEALLFYQKSLDIKLKRLGEDHPDVATAYHNIGSIYDDQKKFKEAMSFYKKSLSIKLKKLGKNHIHLANTYYNMAVLSKHIRQLRPCYNVLPEGFRSLYGTMGKEPPRCGGYVLQTGCYI